MLLLRVSKVSYLLTYVLTYFVTQESAGSSLPACPGAVLAGRQAAPETGGAGRAGARSAGALAMTESRRAGPRHAQDGTSWMEHDADTILSSALCRLDQSKARPALPKGRSTMPRPASASSSLGWSVSTAGFRWPPDHREDVSVRHAAPRSPPRRRPHHSPKLHRALSASQVGRVREAASRERREFGMSLTRTATQPPTESELALTAAAEAAATAAATVKRRPSPAADASAELSSELRRVLVHSAPPKMCAALQQAGAAVLRGWAQQVVVLLRRPSRPKPKP